MPNDLITLKALSLELTDALRDGRVDKVGMPSEDELVLLIRARGVNRLLYATCRSDMPRLHFTKTKLANMPVPPAFCMLARKRLTGGVVKEIKCLNEDRLIEITVLTRNELNDATITRVIVEIMGGASNIILADENFKIIDAVKRIMNEHSRPVFPGVEYTYPERHKKLLSDIEGVRQTVETHVGDPKGVYSEINGISKESATELLTLSAETEVENATRILVDMYHDKSYAPCIMYDGEKIIGYYAYPYRSVKDKYKVVPYSSLSEAMETYYSEGAEKARKNRETLSIKRKLKTLLTKVEKRLAEAKKTIEESAEKERFLELGEILKCNINRIKKGASIIECDDFYNTQRVKIALNPAISPKKNVEYYFKKYNKAKGAEAHARQEIEKNTELKEYLESIKASIENSDTTQEYEEIRLELDALIAPKKTASVHNPRKPKKTPPLRLKIDGYTVYIGKNNKQNEEVTFGLASGGDIWLHAKNYHGAHGIIIAENGPVPERVLEAVAEIVAYYSEAKTSPKAEVDYTRRKFVKKLGKPGLVTYTDYKTIVVTPKAPPSDNRF